MAYKYKKGFTLVEILISLSLLALIALVIGYVFVAHFKLFNNVKSLVDISSSNKLVLDEIITQTREGNAIVSTCSGCGGSTTGSDTLILQLWPLDSTNTPFKPISNNYDYVVYSINPSGSTNLVKQTIPDATSNRKASSKIMASDISSLGFSYNNANPTQATEVTISVQNSIKIINRTQSITQVVNATLRNK